MACGLIRLFLIALALSFGTSALAENTPVGAPKLSTVGIISDLGDQAEIEYVGATVFGNKLTYLPISPWNVDSWLVDDVSAAIGNRFNVQTAQIDPKLLAHVRSGFFKSQTQLLEEAMRSAPSGNFDAYLVFLRESESLPYPSNQMISGLGVYRQWPGIGGPDPHTHYGEAIIHATYSIFLVDGKSLHVVGMKFVRSLREEKQSLTDHLLMLPRPLFSPHIYTGEADWPTTADAITESQQNKLREGLADLLKATITDELTKAGSTVGPGGAAMLASPN